MKIKKDFHLVDQRLMEAGYATLSAYDICFDRYYSDEEKEKNRQTAVRMTQEQWNELCTEESRQLETKMKNILECMDSRYDIHQANPEKSSMDHYRSNWDFFFSKSGSCMDNFRLGFNSKRTSEKNLALLNEVCTIIGAMEEENICCIVRYTTVVTPEQQARLNEEAETILSGLAKSGEFIRMWNIIGRIRLVRENNGNPEYGFFKKGAKSRYYRVKPEEAVLWKQAKKKEAV